MQTYRQKIKAPAFSWKTFLKRDPKNITEDQWNQATDMAGDWPTCACGNQCAIIPRSEEGTPRDTKLWVLGVAFFNDVMRRRLPEARQAMRKIELRSAALIAQIQNKAAKQKKKSKK